MSMPTLFIPHGAGPCFFMDWQPADSWTRMAEFLRGVAASLPQRPSAILMVSAHWLTDRFSVTAGARPELIYDYYGFPPHTYQLRYDAPGSPALAAQVGELLGAAGIAHGAAEVNVVTRLGTTAAQGLPHRHLAKHGDTQIKRPACAVATDQWAAVLLRQRQQATAESGQPRFVGVGQCQCQCEA